MVNIILNVFEKTSTWSDEEVASKVLEEIEEYGMSPPSYIGLMRDGSKFIRGENEGDTMLVSGRWEPEE